MPVMICTVMRVGERWRYRFQTRRLYLSGTAKTRVEAKSAIKQFLAKHP